MHYKVAADRALQASRFFPRLSGAVRTNLRNLQASLPTMQVPCLVVPQLWLANIFAALQNGKSERG